MYVSKEGGGFPSPALIASCIEHLRMPPAGFLLQVLSGDSVVIRGQPRNGPPPEKTLVLSNIIAPKLARRVKEGEATKQDEVRKQEFISIAKERFKISNHLRGFHLIHSIFGWLCSAHAQNNFFQQAKNC